MQFEQVAHTHLTRRSSTTFAQVPETEILMWIVPLEVAHKMENDEQIKMKTREA